MEIEIEGNMVVLPTKASSISIFTLYLDHLNSCNY